MSLKLKQFVLYGILYAVFLGTSLPLLALTYPLSSDTDVVGEVRIATTHYKENLLDLGLRYGIGYYELLEANAAFHPKRIKPGTPLVIPSQFILPNAPHEGIVVNLAELRLYLYVKDRQEVRTFPVGIGRSGWNTPLASAKIIDKRINPSWYVPDGVYEEMKRRGVIIPRVWPPGPNNPLGKVAMRLSIPAYDIHGTNRDDGVGRRSSSGCIRMLNDDASDVYANVDVGTQVTIVNQPIKIGRRDQKIFLEVHTPLYESPLQQAFNPNWMKEAKLLIDQFTHQQPHAQIDWDRVHLALTASNGVPIQIGVL